MKKERGFILITLYLLLVVFLAHGTALMTRAFAEIRGAERFQASSQAFYLAESGLDWAVTQLRGDPLFPGGTGTIPGVDGSYTVNVRGLGGNRWEVISAGTLTQGPDTLAVLSVESIVRRVTPFAYGMFGDQSVSLTGNAQTLTDSYNSSTGPYNALTAGSNGDVGTNGIFSGNVSLTGNATVHGDVLVGVGGDPSVVVTLTGGSAITGSQSALDAPQPVEPVIVPGGLVNQGNLSVSGNSTINLPGGTYLYNNISVSGNGSLNFTGPTILYLTGTLSVAGNGIGTASNLPPNLMIYVQGSGNVSFTGNGGFYGAVYAPESSVLISGNGTFFGAALGNTVHNASNGGVHYDEALQDVGGPGSQVRVISWREL